jgi:hypothetical protein
MYLHWRLVEIVAAVYGFGHFLIKRYQNQDTAMINPQAPSCPWLLGQKDDGQSYILLF